MRSCSSHGISGSWWQSISIFYELDIERCKSTHFGDLYPKVHHIRPLADLLRLQDRRFDPGSYLIVRGDKRIEVAILVRWPCLSLDPIEAFLR